MSKERIKRINNEIRRAGDSGVIQRANPNRSKGKLVSRGGDPHSQIGISRGGKGVAG